MTTKALSLVSHMLLCCVAVAACSAKDDVPSSQEAPTQPGAPGGSASMGGTEQPGAPGGTMGLQPSSDPAGVRGSGTGTAATPGATGMDGVSGIEPIAIDQCGADNPAGLSDTQIARLKAGGSADSMRLLYPYDGTVFPRGLSAPTVMWDGGGSDAVYLHLKAGRFDYQGCLQPDSAGQLTIPQDAWDAAGRQTGGKSDPLSIELTTLSGQAANGPLKASWVIAQATLKGSIYYNSYNSQLASDGGQAGGLGGLLGGGGATNGAVLRIRPGQTAELFARDGTCTGCHSVSAYGERMIMVDVGSASDDLFAGLGGLFGGGGGGGANRDGQTYALTPDTQPNPDPARPAAGSSFTGLTPDGKLYVSSSSAAGIGPRGAGAESALYETDTGNVVSDSGIPTSAMMPTFSPDGTLLVFSDAAQGGKAIVVMDFDSANRKASNARTVVTMRRSWAGPSSCPTTAGSSSRLPMKRTSAGRASV